MVLLIACTGQIGGRPQARTRPGLAKAPVPAPAIPAPPTVVSAAPTPTPPLITAPAPPPPPPPPEPSPATVPPAVTFTIPLENVTDLSALDRRPETAEALDAARRYPSSRIYLAGYVDEVDARARHADPRSVSDQLVIDMARYLSGRGVDAARISGRGMGVNPTIGRAVVVSIDVAGPPAGEEPSPREVAEREAALFAPERLPAQNRSFKEVAGAALYRVGPGDTLVITNHLTTAAAPYTVTVSPVGTISFDVVLNAPVAGLTTPEIESLLTNVMRRYYRSPRISVAVSAFASRTVTLITPGGSRSITLGGRTTILDFVARNGIAGGGVGPASLGLPDLKSIRVLRGRKQFDVNFFRLVLDQDWKENFVLDDGDIVYLTNFIESRNYALVLGAVNAPGIQPIRTRLTATEALYAAGGPARGAYLPHAQIIRGAPDRPEVFSADFDLVIDKGMAAADKQLASGDVLYVPRNRITNWNQFLGDVMPTIQLALIPFQRALFFTGRGDFESTSTTIINNPPQPIVPQ